MRYSSPEVLQVVKTQLPMPGKGKVPIRVLASGIEYTYTLILRHVYPQTGLVRLPLTLAAYCRHAVTATMSSQEINKWEPRWLSEKGGTQQFNRLCGMRDREVRAMLALARSQRLTNQSRYNAKSASTIANNSPLGLEQPIAGKSLPKA